VLLNRALVLLNQDSFGNVPMVHRAFPAGPRVSLGSPLPAGSSDRNGPFRRNARAIEAAIPTPANFANYDGALGGQARWRPSSTASRASTTSISFDVSIPQSPYPPYFFPASCAQ
jgi:hypothetical protein